MSRRYGLAGPLSRVHRSARPAPARERAGAVAPGHPCCRARPGSSVGRACRLPRPGGTAPSRSRRRSGHGANRSLGWSQSSNRGRHSCRPGAARVGWADGREVTAEHQPHDAEGAGVVTRERGGVDRGEGRLQPVAETVGAGRQLAERDAVGARGPARRDGDVEPIARIAGERERGFGVCEGLGPARGPGRAGPAGARDCEDDKQSRCAGAAGEARPHAREYIPPVHRATVKRAPDSAVAAGRQARRAGPVPARNQPCRYRACP